MQTRALVPLVVVAMLALPACGRAQEKRRTEAEAWKEYRATLTGDVQKAEADRKLGEEYRRAGRCRNAALRTSATADEDYRICSVGESLRPPKAYLGEFRAQFGPELAQVTSRCPTIQPQIEAALVAHREARRSGGPQEIPATSLARFQQAYRVFCTDF